MFVEIKKERQQGKERRIENIVVKLYERKINIEHDTCCIFYINIYINI